MKKYGNDYRQRGKKFEYTGKWYGSSLSVKELKRHALNNTYTHGPNAIVSQKDIEATVKMLELFMNADFE